MYQSLKALKILIPILATVMLTASICLIESVHADDVPAGGNWKPAELANLWKATVEKSPDLAFVAEKLSIDAQSPESIRNWLLKFDSKERKDVAMVGDGGPPPDVACMTKQSLLDELLANQPLQDGRIDNKNKKAQFEQVRGYRTLSDDFVYQKKTRSRL